MSSGINIKDECQDRFKELKIGHKYSYIIYKIDKDLKNIEVDCLGELGESYGSFCEKLMAAGSAGEGRYGVVDCEYAKGKNKLVFIMWLQDSELSVKQKMMYSSSKKALRDKLQGIGKEMQCNDPDDLAWSAVVEKCQSKYD